MADATEFSDRLAELPEEAKHSIRRGYQILATLTAEQRRDVLAGIIATLRAGGGEFNATPLMKDAELSAADTSHIVTALSLSVVLLTELTISAEQFVQLGRRELVSDEATGTAQEVAELIIQERPQLERSLRQESLAAAVLPSLMDIQVVVDARFRVVEAGIKDVVPVAIMRILTDLDNELSVQLSKRRLEITIEKLQKTLSQIILIEKYLSKDKPE